jgi:hypothetical protein
MLCTRTNFRDGWRATADCVLRKAETALLQRLTDACILRNCLFAGLPLGNAHTQLARSSPRRAITTALPTALDPDSFLKVHCSVLSATVHQTSQPIPEPQPLVSLACDLQVINHCLGMQLLSPSALATANVCDTQKIRAVCCTLWDIFGQSGCTLQGSVFTPGNNAALSGVGGTIQRCK